MPRLPSSHQFLQQCCWSLWSWTSDCLLGMEILFWINFWITLLKCTFSIALETLNLNILPFFSTSPNVNMFSSTLLDHLIEIIIKSKCSHSLLLVSKFSKRLTCIIIFDVHNNFVWLLLFFSSILQKRKLKLERSSNFSKVNQQVSRKAGGIQTKKFHCRDKAATALDWSLPHRDMKK